MHFFVLTFGIIFADSLNKLRNLQIELENLHKNESFANVEYNTTETRQSAPGTKKHLHFCF